VLVMQFQLIKQLYKRMILLFETESKTVPITKDMVRKAYKKVKSNQGSAGIDKEFGNVSSQLVEELV
jgi:hypothetical protein